MNPNRSFYHYLLSTVIDRLTDGVERVSDRLGSGSMLLRIREVILQDSWIRFLYLTFLCISVNPYLLLFQPQLIHVLLVNFLLIGVVGISTLFRRSIWLQQSIFRFGSLATGAFFLSFTFLLTVSAVTITRIGIISEMLMIGLFLLIALAKPKNGLYLFALTLPILTYRPLLAFILLLVLVLLVVKPDYARVKASLKNHLNLAVVLFLIMLFVTAITSVEWMESLTQFALYYFISFVLYLLIIVIIDDSETMKKFVWMLITSTALISIYGIYQYLTLEFTSARWVDYATNPGLTKRIYATFGNPNIFGQFLIMILPLNFALLLYTKQWGSRFLLSFLFMLSFIALMLTYSRGAWLAIAAAIFLLVAMVSRRLLVVGIIAASIGVNFLPATIMMRIQTMMNPSADSSGSYRFEMWKSAFAMIRDFWKTGIGSDPTTFFKVYADYMMPDVRVFHFHNIYLMAIVTGGILLLAALLYMFYQNIRTATVALFLNNDSSSFNSYLIKGAMAAFTAIALAGLTEDVWRQYRVDFMFWMTLAIVAASYNMIRWDKKHE